MKKRTVKRTERGWAGHFCGANNCRFRRNTLLECLDTRIVVSTVGLYEPRRGYGFIEVGGGRFFETFTFHAAYDGRFWDVDVQRQIAIDEPWAINEPDADDKANDMHEHMVDVVTQRLIAGEDFLQQG